jgi:hypothetical protein
MPREIKLSLKMERPENQKEDKRYFSSMLSALGKVASSRSKKLRFKIEGREGDRDL